MGRADLVNRTGRGEGHAGMLRHGTGLREPAVPERPSTVQGVCGYMPRQLQSLRGAVKVSAANRQWGMENP